MLLHSLPTAPPARLLDAYGQEEKSETRIELKTFQVFLSGIAAWARDEKIARNGFWVCIRILDATSQN